MCPFRCGNRMHKCKLGDHMSYICPLAEVPCICASFGCPRRMKRYLLGKHLIKCPASIVHCTVEWNRMPRLLGEKRPFILPPTCSCCIGSSMYMNRSSDMRFSSNHSCLLSFHTEKFDLALTARDQAILEAGSKVSDRTKGALRCDLTKLYPALPMTSPLYNGFLSVSTDGSGFPAISSPYAVIPATPSGLPICDVSDQDTFFIVASEFERNHYLYFYDEITEDTNDKTNVEVERGGGKSFSAEATPAQSPDGDGATLSLIVGKSSDSSSSTPSTTLRLSSSCPLSETMSWAISDRSLQVDCQMEFFPRYVQKPAAMYTFLCDQDVPRAAYARHTLLHSEAIVQADYWLEQRCPLAYLGCPFSVVRLRPNGTSPPSRLAYIPTLNAFTVCYTSSVSTNGQSTSLVDNMPKAPTTVPGSLLAAAKNTTTNGYVATSWLDLLPLEVIKKIINMLDEVSLISLTRVSPSLAEVCRRTLPTRGVVSPLWQRCRGALGVSGWRIRGFVWSLPRCGEPVNHWHITDSPAPLGTQLTLHLQNDCAFYEVLRAHQPFCLYNPAKEKPPFLSEAKRQPEYI
ncbi:unnamed protein product [Hymenolepis diminuta]|nr:unnamed protein product [Hymenolepis diminuta]